MPLVGPSAILLALMASGMNGQASPSTATCRCTRPSARRALRALEAESRARARAQLFIETPYRNAAMLATLVASAARRDTRLCVAADLTLPTEDASRARTSARRGRGAIHARFAKRPALFVLQA